MAMRQSERIGHLRKLAAIGFKQFLARPGAAHPRAITGQSRSETLEMTQWPNWRSSSVGISLRSSPRPGSRAASSEVIVVVHVLDLAIGEKG
jgi:hypothetical protein